MSYAQFGYLKYPSYKTVLIQFFNNYTLDNEQDRILLKFPKKRDGWHAVVFKNYNIDTLSKDGLIWSRKSGTFQKIDFTTSDYSATNQKYFEKLSNDWGATYFDKYPYYNYPGWDWDVIQDYKDAPNLPDSIEYNLGRTYSYFADNLLNNNSGFSDKRFRFELPEGPNSLSADQLKKYYLYHNLAIETFAKVKKMNPNYETIIGDISIKLDDEYMVGYLDMLIYQSQEEANKCLKDNLFDDFTISAAKNYLMSCDSNAILFTFGDNDAYPLLYIQEKEKFRRDVLVINGDLVGGSGGYK